MIVMSGAQQFAPRPHARPSKSFNKNIAMQLFSHLSQSTKDLIKSLVNALHHEGSLQSVTSVLTPESMAALASFGQG